MIRIMNGEKEESFFGVANGYVDVGVQCSVQGVSRREKKMKTTKMKRGDFGLVLYVVK